MGWTAFESSLTPPPMPPSPSLAASRPLPSASADFSPPLPSPTHGRLRSGWQFHR
jgi:hypothetical protein